MNGRKLLIQLSALIALSIILSAPLHADQTGSTATSPLSLVDSWTALKTHPISNVKNASLNDATIQMIEHSFDDGVKIRVLYTQQVLMKAGVGDDFVQRVLEASKIAYNTLTHEAGFNTKGYSFAEPDLNYAYDPDKVIEILIGYKGMNTYQYLGFEGGAFSESPCFDTVQVSKNAYQSYILISSDYGSAADNWQFTNPSELGSRDLDQDLRGTLTHEMLHCLVFYYNKNLKCSQKMVLSGQAYKADWYIEGLARYFETKVGARHDYYSKGFRQVLHDRVRFSRGGCNYLMRYPDQPFATLRYENALFWRFLDYRYGLEPVEKLTREFRSQHDYDFRKALERCVERPFSELITDFALSMLTKDFGLADDNPYLKDVAMTQLKYENNSLYLLDGYGRSRELGKTCDTDWVGRWDENKNLFSHNPIAGDGTDQSDISALGHDFFVIDMQNQGVHKIQFENLSPDASLAVRIVYLEPNQTKCSVSAVKVVPPMRLEKPSVGRFDVSVDLVDQKMYNAEPTTSKKLYVVITNLDINQTGKYQFSVE